MDTPIYDFARNYAAKNALRLHMPGHKGLGQLGVEALDLTEIAGADSLYEAAGIIAKSEENASKLFGCPTFYSCEGASLAVRAMAALATGQGRSQVIAAARNVHKSFVYAAALLGLEVLWLEGAGESTSPAAWSLPKWRGRWTPRQKSPPPSMSPAPTTWGTWPISRHSQKSAMTAACSCWWTTPTAPTSSFCRSLSIPWIWGRICAVIRRIKPCRCSPAGRICTSRPSMKISCPEAKGAMALFGSTSPSYLILESLDLANGRLQRASQANWRSRPNGSPALIKASFRPWLLPLRPGAHEAHPLSQGVWLPGDRACQYLEERNMVCEFADPDFLVLMFCAENAIGCFGGGSSGAAPAKAGESGAAGAAAAAGADEQPGGHVCPPGDGARF